MGCELVVSLKGTQRALTKVLWGDVCGVWYEVGDGEEWGVRTAVVGKLDNLPRDLRRYISPNIVTSPPAYSESEPTGEISRTSACAGVAGVLSSGTRA